MLPDRSENVSVDNLSGSWTIKPFSKLNNSSSLKSSDKHLKKILQVQNNQAQLNNINQNSLQSRYSFSKALMAGTSKFNQ